ncbi:unnamed protein product [Onchocerca flexuosa]|uniref:ABC transmembrane type-1 domain-containing protein n=1 Tax=Onchocerca flexuosa TaxID=387005 RepID=A0A183HXE6_9BILA|nr:unnamed protein product [Onchocerca flexuosa]
MPTSAAASYYFGLLLVQNSWSQPYNVFQVIEALNVASFIMLTAASYLPEYLRARISASLMFHMKDQEPLIDNLSEAGIHQVKIFCYSYFSLPILENDELAVPEIGLLSKFSDLTASN